MKTKKLRFILPLLCILPMLGSCSGRDKRAEVAKNRAEWEASLPDSLEKFRRRSQEIADSIPIVSTQVAEAMAGFITAGGYVIPKGYEAKFPPSSSGLLARISTKGGPEICATAEGTFHSLIIAADGVDFTSSEIPGEMKASGLNTLTITGNEADSIAKIITGANGPVKVTLGNSQFTLDESAREEIAKTYTLLQLRRTQTRLEKQLPATARKIRAAEEMIERVEKRENRNNK